ncbi:hypothetical protein F8388_017317, partial [Cannabis sativa]
NNFLLNAVLSYSLIDPSPPPLSLRYFVLPRNNPPPSKKRISLSRGQLWVHHLGHKIRGMNNL